MSARKSRKLIKYYFIINIYKNHKFNLFRLEIFLRNFYWIIFILNELTYKIKIN